jgi:quinol monooxygenase YgiN
VINYKQRAEECRKLAKLSPKPEDWGHLEMVETWEKLAALQEYSQQLRSSGVLRPKPSHMAAG